MAATTARASSSGIDKFLDIAAKHKIGPMLVFFDGVWDPDPQSGLQREPAAGRAQQRLGAEPGPRDPCRRRQAGRAGSRTSPMLKRYADDDRVLAWDLFNEPDNPNANSYGPMELKNKDEVAARLVESVPLSGPARSNPRSR